ncbi:MAG: 16S rRNA (cytosine(967)-C(5))-methyltransferase RsmB [Desulfuromonadaceae bacterium]|nr:16S rRNA (cytosine(967)-C(5))-methyltransferase RsmB [Desulfuromonadaceae bacterium]MDD2849409.1 16S rRNA (cytosine(967)-C(5))-methyltransferase RsmB [Desulfuromonadaceae bacterium]MDD4130023.1 16S rRNA (cytosine(967)-C(5))-methyltransferase RsmB [Desulfuromonadaceae bacterium]
MIIRRAAKGTPSANPRQAACETLLRIRKEGGFADRLIDIELSNGVLCGPDRGLYAELVFGVLRRQGTLDHILLQLLEKPMIELDPQALVILRIGLYQLTCLDRIPESAAVNESVNLAKEITPGTSGLINAVLRNYLRRRDTISFPDITTNPVAAIAARHSQPEWLVEQWLDQLGATEAQLLAEASSQQPPLTLRVNTLRSSREELLQKFKEHGIEATLCRFSPDGIAVTGRHIISALPGFEAGLFAVQDEASQIATLLLGAAPGERIWDACAAPGGKCCHIAQQMDDRGELIATDISRSKLTLVQDNLRRLGISSATTAVADLHQPDTFPDGSFDRILLDAPCSGLGVIRRNPEAKWRLFSGDITRLAAVQKTLLKNASGRLKPGGTLLYSTCSTSEAENELVVEDFLLHHPGFVLENLKELFPAWSELIAFYGMFRVWPHRHGMDGFFAARIKRVK